MEIVDIFGNLPELETPRLRLRKLVPSDAEDLFAYAADPEVVRYTSWEPHRSIENSHAFLVSVIAAYEAGDVANWGIEHRAERRLIGTCGYIWWNISNASAEIGYALSRAYWNQGLMTEAAQAVVDFGFREMGLNRIEARCEVPNVGSARVMEKVGMRYEGTLRQVVFAKGQFRDLKLYAVLRQEWSRVPC